MVLTKGGTEIRSRTMFVRRITLSVFGFLLKKEKAK